MTECPNDAQIVNLLEGRLPDEHFDGMAAHVDGCSRCQVRLEQLEALDVPFAALIKKVILDQDEQYAEEPELRSAIDQTVHSIRQPKLQESPLPGNNTDSTSDRKTLGDFRIIRELGRGGMGVVYEAEQISLGRRVALKMRPFVALLDERRIRRFQNESRAAASLEHPNIVTVYAVGMDRGVHYFAMQFIDGQNLEEIIAKERKEMESSTAESLYGQVADAKVLVGNKTEADIPVGSTVEWNRDVGKRLKSRRKSRRDATESNRANSTVGLGNAEAATGGLIDLDFQRIAGLMYQAASALGYAHKNGIIHRDVKPSNLLIDNRGHLWVTDFGLARIDNDSNLTMPGDVIGTIHYMSPEQAAGRTELVDRRTDVYSLGATLYELLTHRPVFDGKNREKLLLKVASSEPVAPSQFNSAIPVDLETITLKAIAKELDERYSTADELAADLKRFIEKRAILARRPTRFERLIKLVRRHRRMTAAILGSLACLLTISLILVGLFSTKNTELRKSLTDVEVLTQDLSQALKDSEKSRREADNQKIKAQLSAYAAQFRLAYDAYENQDPVSSARILENLIPQENEIDVRGFEWNLFKQKLSRNRETVSISEKALYTVCLSPNEKKLATAGEAAIIYIFDPVSKTATRTIDTGQIEVNGLAFAPDNLTLVSTGDDGTIKYWNTDTGEHIRTVESGVKKVYAIKFVLDGTQIVSTGDENLVQVWDAATGENVGSMAGHSKKVIALAVDSTGTLVASACRGNDMILWNIATRSPIRKYHTEDQYLRITALAFAPNNRYIVSGHNSGIIARWSLIDHEHQMIRNNLDAILSLAFSVDGRSLYATDKGGALKTYDYRMSNVEAQHAAEYLRPTDEWAVPRPTPDYRLRDLAFSVDGEWSCALSDGDLYFYNRSTKTRQKLEFPEPDRLNDYDRTHATDLSAFSPDGQWFVFLNEVYRCVDKNWQWHVRIDTPAKRCFSVAFADDSHNVLFGRMSGDVATTDLLTGSRMPELDLENPVRSGSSLFPNEVLTISDDGRFVGTSSIGEQVCIFDRKSRELISVCRGHGGDLFDMDFSPDGRHLASSGANSKDIHIWDVSTGDLLRTLAYSRVNDGCIEALAYSPDGKWLAASTCGTPSSVHIWDFEHDCVIWQHPQGAKKVQFSANGLELYCGGTDHGHLRVLDLSQLKNSTSSYIERMVALSRVDELPKPIQNQHFHNERAFDCVVMSASGNVITVGSDGNLCVSGFDLDKHQQILFNDNDRDATARRDFDISIGNDAVVVRGEKGLRLYRNRGGQFVLENSRPVEQMWSLCCRNDGKTFVTGHGSGNIQIWNIDPLEMRDEWLIEAGQAVMEVALSSSGKMVAVLIGNDDYRVRLYDITTGQRLSTPKSGNCSRICFSPDDQWLAMTGLNHLHLWNLQNPAKNRELQKHADAINSIHFDPLGRYVATASDDRTIILWDLATGSIVRQLNGHRSKLYQVAFTPDGRSLVSSGENDGIKIWNVATGQHLMDFSNESNNLIGFDTHVPAIISLKKGSNPVVTFVEGQWNSLSPIEQQALRPRFTKQPTARKID